MIPAPIQQGQRPWDAKRKKRVAFVVVQILGGIAIAVSAGASIGVSAGTFSEPYGIGGIFAGMVTIFVGCMGSNTLRGYEYRPGLIAHIVGCCIALLVQIIAFGLAIKDTKRGGTLHCTWHSGCERYNGAPAIALCIILVIVIFITICAIICNAKDLNAESQTQAAALNSGQVQHPSAAAVPLTSPYPSLNQAGTYQQVPYTQPAQLPMEPGNQASAPPFAPNMGPAYPEQGVMQGPGVNTYYSLDPGLPPVGDQNLPPPPSYNEAVAHETKQ